MKKILEITLAEVQAMLKLKGFEEFTSDLVPNIVGIRSTELDGEDFDDRCHVWWYEGGELAFSKNYTITTNPGTYYLKNPIAGSKGTLILCPGQHINCWQVGMHKGKQLAFVQTGAPMQVYRDRNRDGKMDFDPKTIEAGYFGMNGHHGALSDVNLIGQWSAGCQVWRFHKAHQDMMNLVQDNAKKTKQKDYTYTLLEQKDF